MSIRIYNVILLLALLLFHAIFGKYVLCVSNDVILFGAICAASFFIIMKMEIKE